MADINVVKITFKNHPENPMIYEGWDDQRLVEGVVVFNFSEQKKAIVFPLDVIFVMEFSVRSVE